MHIRLNLAKMVGEIWDETLIQPLYKAIRGLKKPARLDAREVAAILEILYQAYCDSNTREMVLALLMPIADRFDANAFIFLFEFTLPLTCVAYDGVFKGGCQEEYTMLLAMYCYQFGPAYRRRNYKTAVLYKLAGFLHFQATSGYERLAPFCMFLTDACCCTHIHTQSDWCMCLRVGACVYMVAAVATLRTRLGQ
jgi:hypothetical protein